MQKALRFVLLFLKSDKVLFSQMVKKKRSKPSFFQLAQTVNIFSWPYFLTNKKVGLLKAATCGAVSTMNWKKKKKKKRKQPKLHGIAIKVNRHTFFPNYMPSKLNMKRWRLNSVMTYCQINYLQYFFVWLLYNKIVTLYHKPYKVGKNYFEMHTSMW